MVSEGPPGSLPLRWQYLTREYYTFEFSGVNIFEYFVNIWGGNIQLVNTHISIFRSEYFWIFCEYLRWQYWTREYYTFVFSGVNIFEFLWILIWQDWIRNTLTIRICICRGEYLSKIILNCLNANLGYF